MAKILLINASSESGQTTPLGVALTKMLSNLTKVLVPSQRVFIAAALGVHDEVAGKYGDWNKRMMGAGIDRHKESYAVLKASNLNYTYIRQPWLYNDNQKTDYVKLAESEPFIGVQMTRQAVVHYIMDLIASPELDNCASIGLWEPGSENKAKPAFVEMELAKLLEFLSTRL